MKEYIKDIVLAAVGGSDAYQIEVIQELWSGYGEIIRVGVKDSDRKSVIVKHITAPLETIHPRGWSGDLSHKRKVDSYQIECNWYKHWAGSCGDRSVIPECFALEKIGDEICIVLEDLDLSGYPDRVTSPNLDNIESVLSWLANFHATFLQRSPEGLWPIGTYWHLDTRPDELKALSDSRLRVAASYIDDKLNSASYLTFVHGDAKLANFCFSKDGTGVAGLDFQYVGGGCGMKDVAYFIGSCLYEDDCERYESRLLDIYFNQLKIAIETLNSDIDPAKVEAEWRSLYYFAWADFHRFLKGWSPGHWKINSYSERVCRSVLDQLDIE